MIKASNISFAYNESTRFDFPDIECPPKASCLIIGKSGVGKTTLLHILGGVLKPDQGSVLIGDADLSKLDGTKLDKYRGKNIGIVFQKPHFISSLNILENLLLTQNLAGVRMSKSDILMVLKSLEIEDRAYSKPSKLSQGELQRASVARAVMNQPKLILADEPTSALDDESCEQVLHLLQNTAREMGAALVIVTHDGRLKELIDHQIVLS
ncbi:ABC transporter ATP-binding protein [Portibacter marinus]|uniref:ABC transporter ATP-binding protein n=1 Tax=Portibacter marinus TaxID=2898660 RepID=UPI001F42B67D|nr:ATP-binding cassette domain-containing protein [Portibacter marinus]